MFKKIQWWNVFWAHIVGVIAGGGAVLEGVPLLAALIVVPASVVGTYFALHWALRWSDSWGKTKECETKGE